MAKLLNRCTRLQRLHSLHNILYLWSRSAVSSSSSKPHQTERIQSAVVDTSYIHKIRNIGISAHIDSGKTTVSERILFYTGRISEMHEVKGKDQVGATMDSMELERQRGITIQSAATKVHWKDYSLNLIDTPGHVDFTIEVERALRVLDGAVLVLCGVGGVQSQTYTVDRQMRRYRVPHVAFINKLDRVGARPDAAIKQMRAKLGYNAAAVQFPIGQEDKFEGIVDLIANKVYYFRGEHGELVEESDVPAYLEDACQDKYYDLIEAVANADDKIGELFLEEKYPSAEELKDAIRRATIARKFVPVLLGSALKNKGIQLLLDSILDYLPNPTEVQNFAQLVTKETGKVENVTIESDPQKLFVGLAFKIEMGRFGQLTYLRVYQGTMKKGMWVINTRNGRRIKVSRSVQMFADKMEEIDAAEAGSICAMYGVECRSGDTFVSHDGPKYSMEPIFVPEPVISQALILNSEKDRNNLAKGLRRFQLEDPTFRVDYDEESKETIISGMGELHLEIYGQRLRKEYMCDVTQKQPTVAYRETLSAPIEFNYLHKKQTGGAGQYAGVQGKFVPLEGDELTQVVFEDMTSGSNIPSNYIPYIEKSMRETFNNGIFSGHKMIGVKMILEDGKSHIVDSSDLAFRTATRFAIVTTIKTLEPKILEPIMLIEVNAPLEYQKDVLGGLAKQKASILGIDAKEGYCTVYCEVPLRDMFGYSSALRTITQGKGEFSMEFSKYLPVNPDLLHQLIQDYEDERKSKETNKK